MTAKENRAGTGLTWLSIGKMVDFCECGDRGSTVVKVLCYKSESRSFDPSWRHWIFH